MRIAITLIFGLLLTVRVAVWFANVQGPLPECAISLPIVGQVDSVKVKAQPDSFVLETWALQILRADTCPQLVGYRARISWLPGDEPRVAVSKGSIVTVDVRLKSPWGSVNPGGFNYRLWLLAEGYQATGYVRRLLHHRPGLSRRADPLAALSIGDTSGVFDEHWRVFRDTGTIHLMVVSGLHVGIFAAVVGAMALVILLPVAITVTNRVVWQDLLWFSVFAVFAYAWLTGGQPPVMRAALCFALVSLSLVLGRKPNLLACLAGVAAMSVLVAPQQVAMTGFWLSYGAVAALVSAYQPRLRRPSWTAALLMTQIVLLLGLSPLLGYVVGPVPLSATIANIVVVPLVSLFLIPGAMLLTMVEALSLGAWLYQARQILLYCFDMVVALLAKFPSTEIGYLSIWQALLGLSWFYMLTLPLTRKSKLAGSVMWLSTWIALPERMPPGEFRITALDVGQGSAAIVDTRNTRIVVDTGASSPTGFNFATAAVIPALRRLGGWAPDLVFITHVDDDHAGGLFALLRVYPGVKVIGPGIDCRHNKHWHADGVEFRILRAVEAGTRNGRSCTLVLSGTSGQAFFSGDIGRQAELQLKADLPSNIDLLLAPHHGSITSSHPALVKQLKPAWVINTAGKNNKYGHPHSKIVARYNWVGATGLQTGEVGAVSWWSEHNRVEVSRRELLGLQLPLVRQVYQSP